MIAKERLLSPQLVIEAIASGKSNITLAHVRSYILNELTKENEVIKSDLELTKKYKSDTDKLKQQLETLKNGTIVIQGAKCAACQQPLELPSIHFLCQHSYHKHCFQSFADNENECLDCLPQNKHLLELLKAQEYNKDLHEIFHSQLEKVSDGFSLAAEYFGRGVFKKVTVVTDSPPHKPKQEHFEITNKVVPKVSNLILIFCCFNFLCQLATEIRTTAHSSVHLWSRS